MATILTEQTQYVDASGRPLVGGSVYIGDVNADPVLNPKAIFSDRALTAALANPQTLDANGRASNKIWTDGKYSLQVNDINGVQVFQDLDRGESAVTIDILNDITEVITTPANNDTFIITRDEAQSKVTYANLFSATDVDIADLQGQINALPAVIDEDDFSTDSATRPPSQQSTKAYVDGKTWTDWTTVTTVADAAKDITSLPAGITDIEIALRDVSMDGTSSLLLQLGTGGTPTASGYAGGYSIGAATGGYSTGFTLFSNSAALLLNGGVALTHIGGNDWVAKTSTGYTVNGGAGAGGVTLSGTLDMFRLTSISGAQDFDNGKFAYRYK